MSSRLLLLLGFCLIVTVGSISPVLSAQLTDQDRRYCAQQKTDKDRQNCQQQLQQQRAAEQERQRQQQLAVQKAAADKAAAEQAAAQKNAADKAASDRAAAQKAAAQKTATVPDSKPTPPASTSGPAPTSPAAATKATNAALSPTPTSGPAPTSPTAATKATNAAPRKVTVASIGGWTAGDIVVNARWTGQPSNDPDPKHGKYTNFYAIDSVAGLASWQLNGSGFGTKPGTVKFSDSSISSSIGQWTDGQITLKLTVPYTYTQNPSVTMTVIAADGVSVSTVIRVIGTIQTRGFGQCTWYVANRRTQQRRSLPMGTYATMRSLDPHDPRYDPQYAPQQWDVIDFGTAHTAIITSPVSLQQVSNSDGSKTLTYSFTIGEMNVKPGWGEQESSVPSKFVVRITKTATTIVTGIRSDFSATKDATGYFR